MKKSVKYLIVIAAIVAVALVGALFLSGQGEKTVPLDLNTVNGSPEFYDLTWGMSTEEVDELIKVKHQTYYGSTDGDSVTDGFIYTEKGFKVYHLQAEKAYCNFGGNTLKSVMLIIPKGENSAVTLEDVVSTLTEVYGPTTSANTWVGPITTIGVLDEQEFDQTDKNIVIRYTRTENSQFNMLAFEGGTDAYDPFGLIGVNSVFGKSGAEMVDGLLEGQDYTHETGESFEFYTLYPIFDFMSVPAGRTALELREKEGEGINGITYQLQMDVDDVDGRKALVSDIIAAISQKYGKGECVFSEHYLPDMKEEMGIVDETMDVTSWQARMDEDVEGLYHMTWETDDVKITLFAAVDYYASYTYMSLSFYAC